MPAPAEKLAQFFGKDKTRNPGERLFKRAEDLFVPRFKIKGRKVCRAIFTVMPLVLNPIKKKLGMSDNGQMLGSAQPSRAQIIVRNVPARLNIREKGKKPGIKLALRSFQSHKAELVIPDKKFEDLPDIPLSLLIDVGILNVDKYPVSASAENSFDPAYGFGEFK